ncbi:hypothetical protein GCM10009811_22390 [Nostocoides veronense]|uniref:NlpC/P60 domain-containing protein n=1 Tax=Nostocoides veronense TaxID=330836 RepID=A0ABP4Y0E2_9MICO
MRTGAVLAAAGGLVTAFGLPVAQAAPIAPVVTVPAAKTATAPTLTAPAAVGPVKASYGVIGVKAVAKPKPKPKPVVVATTATDLVASRTAQAPASRSTTRASVPAATTPAPTPAPQPSIPAHGGVLAIAAALSGIPYVYGGSTPAGFDCSGFTMYIFAKVGISLPRTAAAQQAAATPVSNPQPGDLVFFGYPAYHVGIYAGNGMMYDSPRTGLSSGLRAIWSSSATYGRP